MSEATQRARQRYPQATTLAEQKRTAFIAGWQAADPLLRDSPEDRERLRGIVRDVMNEWLTVEPDIVPDDEWDNEADAIIAALKGV